MRVSFLFRRLGLGKHPDVPRSTVLVHPATLALLEGFIVEGDIIRVNGGEPVEVITSDLAFPPVVKEKTDIKVLEDPGEAGKGRVVYAGGILLPGEEFLPPLIDINKESFVALVSEFKKENPSHSLLSYHGIPPIEKYLQLVGSFFGVHVPNAVQLADETPWEELFERWGGVKPSFPASIRIDLVEHRQAGVRETGIHGTFPLRTPHPVYVCENGCRGPFEVCPLCGKRTERKKVCPLCGRLYPLSEGRCPVDGTPLLERATHDPKPFIEKISAMFGSVGDVVFVDGEPEDPKKAYFRKKSNLTVGEEGVVELVAPLYPGDRTVVPRVLVDPIIRIYRFLSLVKGEQYPSTGEELIGRKLVLLHGGTGYVVEIEGTGGNRFTLRKELFYSLPRKDVAIAVYEDVVENGRGIELKEIEKGKDFPYTPYPMRSIFDGEARPDRLVEVYMKVAEATGADPSFAVPLLHPVLRERESRSRKVALYRCTGCGARYNREPLSGRCPRCGEEVRPEREPEEVSIDDLVERFSDNPKLHEYLLLFSKRLKGKVSQKTLLELI